MDADFLADKAGFETLNDPFKRAEERIRLLQTSDSRIRLMKKSGGEENLSNSLGGQIRIL
jgi:hypothetical protein